MLAHSGKCRTEDLTKTTGNTEIKHNPERANNRKHSKTELTWFSRLLHHTQPGNETGLFYSDPECSHSLQLDKKLLILRAP